MTLPCPSFAMNFIGAGLREGGILQKGTNKLISAAGFIWSCRTFILG